MKTGKIGVEQRGNSWPEYAVHWQQGRAWRLEDIPYQHVEVHGGGRGMTSYMRLGEELSDDEFAATFPDTLSPLEIPDYVELNDDDIDDEEEA